MTRAGAGLRWPQVHRVQRARDTAAGRGNDTHTLAASLCAGHRSTSRQRPARRSGAPPGCPRPLLHSPSCAQRRATVATKAVTRARRAPAPAGGDAGPGVPHCCVRCQGRSLRTQRNTLRGLHSLRPPGPRCQRLRQSWRRLSWGRAGPPSGIRYPGCASALFAPRAHPFTLHPRGPAHLLDGLLCNLPFASRPRRREGHGHGGGADSARDHWGLFSGCAPRPEVPILRRAGAGAWGVPCRGLARLPAANARPGLPRSRALSYGLPGPDPTRSPSVPGPRSASSPPPPRRPLCWASVVPPAPPHPAPSRCTSPLTPDAADAGSVARAGGAQAVSVRF